MLGEQHVDQHAVVLLGVPDALRGEHLARPLARLEPAPELGGFELRLDHEADLAAMALLRLPDGARNRIHCGIGKCAPRAGGGHRNVAPETLQVHHQLPEAPPPSKPPPPPLKPPPPPPPPHDPPPLGM